MEFNGPRRGATQAATILAALSLALVFALPFGLRAQDATAAAAEKPPAFATATIKPIDTTPGAAHPVGIKVMPGGHVVITTYSLKGLIGVAFQVGSWQITGGDPWTDSDEYDFDGTAPAATYDPRYSNLGIEDEHLRQMLQTFLIDRFQLKFHRDNKYGTTYTLEKSSKPLGLTPTTLRLAKYYGEGFSGNVGHVMGKGWTLYNTSMPQLARFLSDMYQAPVEDKTGVEGSYDFESKNVQNDADFQKPVEETFKPVISEMGLSLKKSSGPIETFVIDQAANPFPNQ